MSSTSPNLGNLSASIGNKLLMTKLITGLVIFSAASAGGYYAYKKYKDSDSASLQPSSTPSKCPSGQSLNPSCGFCTISCADGGFFNCQTGQCECNSGLVGNAYEGGACLCPNGTFPDASGNCGTGAAPLSCSSGMTSNCPFFLNNCIDVSENCSYRGSVDSTTGYIISNAKIPVVCGSQTACVSYSQTAAWNSAINAYPDILNQMCKSTPCICSGPSCPFPECSGTAMNYIQYDSSLGGCVIKRDCSKVPSSWQGLVTGGISSTCLTKKPDPNNASKCLDLSYSDVKNICENDKNGCPYNYTLSGNVCRAANGTTIPVGIPGCRDSNVNTQMIGRNCASFETESIIVTSIDRATSSHFSGTFYMETSDPIQNVNLWTYTVTKTTPNSGGYFVNDQAAYSTGIFQPYLIGPAAYTINGQTRTYQKYRFELYFSGLDNNPFIQRIGKYRLILSGFQENSGIFNMIYMSKNGIENIKKDNIEASDIAGELVPIIAINNPTGLAKQLMVNPTPVIANTVMSNVNNNSQNILNQLMSSSSSLSTTSVQSLGGLTNLNYLGFNYSLAICPASLCGEIRDSMLAFIGWDISNLLQTAQQMNLILTFYIRRTNPPPITVPTEIPFQVDSTGRYGYISDNQKVGTSYIYEIATILGDPNDQTNPIQSSGSNPNLNSGFVQSFDTYNYYYAKGMASAPRIVPVFYPQYTTSVCNSIYDSQIPNFDILVNPTGQLGGGGYCEPPRNFISDLSYKDWYCNSRYSGTANSFAEVLSGNKPVYLWSDKSGSCQPVNPNKVPTIISNNLNTNPGSFSNWLTGNAGTIVAGCGYISNPSGTGNAIGPSDPLIQSMFTYGPISNGDYLASNSIPGQTGTTDLVSRLKSADSFGSQYVSTWKGDNNNNNINTLVSNLYSCPLESSTGSGYYNTTKSSCAYGDSACIALANSLNCAQNYCPPFNNTPKTKTYTSSPKWWPSSVSGVLNSPACSGEGTFTLNNQQTINISGSCSCNYGYAGSQCIGPSKLRNTIGCSNPTNGACTSGSYALPSQCVFYDKNFDPAIHPENIPPGIDVSYQKFIPGGVGQGCVLNPNPFAWWDVTGVAGYNNSSGGWVTGLCKAGGRTNWNDGSGANPPRGLCGWPLGDTAAAVYGLGSEFGEQNAFHNGTQYAAFSCVMTPQDLDSAVNSKQVFTSPMTNKTYDFSQVSPGSMTPGTKLSGPYGSKYYDGYNYNYMYVTPYGYQENSSNFINNNVPANNMLSWMKKASCSGDNNVGACFEDVGHNCLTNALSYNKY